MARDLTVRWMIWFDARGRHGQAHARINKSKTFACGRKVPKKPIESHSAELCGICCNWIRGKLARFGKRKRKPKNLDRSSRRR